MPTARGSPACSPSTNEAFPSTAPAWGFCTTPVGSAPKADVNASLIIADAPRREAWQLRRLVRRVATGYAKALGVGLPTGLAIIVQRLVFDGRQVNGLLTAYQSDDEKRYVIQLALSVNGRDVSDGELIAALRHELSAVFADAIGKPVLSIALDLERGLPVHGGGSIVELRPQPSVAANGRDQDADPFALSKVTDYQEGEAS